MSQFALLGLILLLQITTVVQIVHRLFLVIRTPKVGGKRWKTATPEMKAWRLSAVEPLVTTILAIPILFIIPSLRSEPYSRLMLNLPYIIPIVSMMVYSWQINKHGERCLQALIASTMIWARIVLLLVSARFFVRRIGEILYGDLFPSLWFVIMPIACAFIIRAVFAIYQNLLIDKVDVEAAASRKRTITFIEDSEEDEMWDEQMALIERLKEEEKVEAQF